LHGAGAVLLPAVAEAVVDVRGEVGTNEAIKLIVSRMEARFILSRDELLSGNPGKVKYWAEPYRLPD
jgi:hypothetical protein